MSKKSRANPYRKPTGNNQTRMRVDYSLAFVGISVGIILVLAPPTTPSVTILWLAVLFACLAYPTLHLVGWIFGHSSKGEKGIAVFCLMLSVIGFGFRIWPHQGRHLTHDQIRGLGKLAQGNPAGIKIMVRVAGNSQEARRYGKEIWDVLYAHNVTGPFVIAAGEEPPSGLEVLVRSEMETSGQAGERFMEGLSDLGMPALIHERYWQADDRSFVLFVGTNPNHD
jgi:hypothetical protein